jgi:hypothetical protein
VQHSSNGINVLVIVQFLAFTYCDRGVSTALYKSISWQRETARAQTVNFSNQCVYRVPGYLHISSNTIIPASRELRVHFFLGSDPTKKKKLDPGPTAPGS